METIRKSFKWGVIIVAISIAALLILYFYNFNGLLTDKISEWADFSSFIGNISMLFLTALNIWIFYLLTSVVAEREAKEHDFEFRRELINSYTHCVYSVFNSIDENNLTCALVEQNLTRALDHFNLMQKFSSSLHTFGTPEYEEFLSKYKLLAKKYVSGEIIGNNDVDREAYEVLALAREIRFKLYTELTQK